jgi:hypothetical protein
MLAVFGIAFVSTHGLWFDEMNGPERTKFWSDFAVAFGTIGLAVVTWASVAETQEVIRGEDRRFRQSRMPVLRFSGKFETTREMNQSAEWFAYDATELVFALKNDGDGPAFRISVIMPVTLTFVNPNNTSDSVTVEVMKERVFVTTYLAAKDTFLIHQQLQPPKGLQLYRVQANKAWIEYYDSSTSMDIYTTDYSAFTEQPTSPFFSIPVSLGGIRL